MLEGVEMSILTEHGSGDDFHRYVHEFTPSGYNRRFPRVLEVANWPIPEKERQKVANPFKDE